MEKLLNSLQSRLVKLEATELEEITKHSKDDAVRLAILLAGIFRGTIEASHLISQCNFMHTNIYARMHIYISSLLILSICLSSIP
jgi:hypothetical protein